VKYTPLFLSPLGLIPAGHPALAGDAALPPNAQPIKFEKFAPAWSGFYGGLNFGVISAKSSLGTFLPTSASLPFENYCWLNNCNFSDSQTATSALGGIQIGYNFQSGNIVYGLELDYGVASAKKTSTAANGLFGGQTETGIDALGTARLRLGYAFDNNLMVYATGGLAYGKVRGKFQASWNGNTYSWADTSGWRTGYAIGGGLEYMFAHNWSIKGEALYYNLGGSRSAESTGNFGTNYSYGITDKVSGAVARIGLNYLFH
jgi:outer membrane immunogenic protein